MKNIIIRKITCNEVESAMSLALEVLNPEEEPKATFLLADGDEFVAIYEYCNLHGLWMSK